MTFRHACVGAALVGALTLAPQAGGDRATVAAQHTHQHARPVNPCQLTGTHVSGVVSVDLRDGRHAELLLVDVSATVSMSDTDVASPRSSPAARASARRRRAALLRRGHA